MGSRGLLEFEIRRDRPQKLIQFCDSIRRTRVRSGDFNLDVELEIQSCGCQRDVADLICEVLDLV